MEATLKQMSFWIKTNPTEQQLKTIQDEQLLYAVEGKVCYLSKSEQAKYNIIEEFILKCLGRIVPTPSDYEIATLLGFEKIEFVSQVTSQIKTQSVVILVIQKTNDDNKECILFPADNQQSLELSLFWALEFSNPI